jgi:hypothetical protein
VLLGRDPAVDQGLPKRSECLFAILVRSKPLGPLVVCQHALTIVREPVIKLSALLCLPLQWTWATAAGKDCYPDRRARQDLQLRTGGRPQLRSSSIRAIDDQDLHSYYARRFSSFSIGCSGCSARDWRRREAAGHRHWPGTDDGFTAVTRADRPGSPDPVTELVVTVLAASPARSASRCSRVHVWDPFSTAVSEWTVFVAEFGASLSSFGGCAMLRPTGGREGAR